MKNWKPRLVFVILSIVNLVFFKIAFDDSILIVKGFLFAEVLLVAAFHDIRTRTVPDAIHLLILLMGLIRLNPLQSVLGLIVVPLPFYIVACWKENNIGGGDIKFVAACGFFLGIERGYVGSLIGLIIAVLISGLIAWIKKDKAVSIPLVPYLGVGEFIGYVLLH